MIVPTMTHDEALSELVLDYEYIHKKMLKLLRKKVDKERRFRTNGVMSMNSTFTSNRLNNWSMELAIDLSTNKIVKQEFLCHVDSPGGLRNHYLMRKHYDIFLSLMFTHHAVSRMKERMNLPDIPTDDLLMNLFLPQENAVVVPANDPSISYNFNNYVEGLSSDTFILLCSKGYFIVDLLKKMSIFRTYLGEVFKDSRNGYLDTIIRLNYIASNGSIFGFEKSREARKTLVEKFADHSMSRLPVFIPISSVYDLKMPHDLRREIERFIIGMSKEKGMFNDYKEVMSTFKEWKRETRAMESKNWIGEFKKLQK